MFVYIGLAFLPSCMMGSRPFLDLLILLTFVLSVKVWSCPKFCIWLQAMQKWSNIRIAHEANAEGIDTMVNMLWIMLANVSSWVIWRLTSRKNLSSSWNVGLSLKSYSFLNVYWRTMSKQWMLWKTSSPANTFPCSERNQCSWLDLFNAGNRSSGTSIVPTTRVVNSVQRLLEMSVFLTVP